MSDSPPNPYVVVSNVNKQFKDASSLALNNVSLNIQSNMMTGLVGPDGAGKSTLLRLIAGLLLPTQGQITIRPAVDIHNAIGYMPQKFGLYEDLTVIQNLKLYADLRGLLGEKRKIKFEQLLAFTDLNAFQHRLAGKLSGGMKQKLGLACSLLGEPELLLLDEPSVGVDPISRKELWAMVNELKAEGMTVIWSTAYLDEAEKCEQVILLNEGQKVFDGKPAELLTHLSHRTFILENIKTNERRALLRKVASNSNVMDSLIQGSNIRILTHKNVHTLTTDMLGIDNEILCRPTPQRFEDAFIDLLGQGAGTDDIFAKTLMTQPQCDHPMIVTEKLTKKFGDFVAVDQIDLQVKRGEIFGLLGPNGAGKSTTFYMLCGLTKPSAGNAWINQVNLAKSAAVARNQMGYMAQKFSLYGGLTVRQNLEFFAKVYGLKNKKRRLMIDTVIKIFHLKDYLNQLTNNLSLGYKQRLSLACSIMHSPAILFLDEPTSGVDPITRREFWNHINSMVEYGVTILVTTHFMDEAEYCDRIALVYRGKNIATGTPDELKSLVATQIRPNPTLEDAFIELVEQTNLKFEQESSV